MNDPTFKHTVLPNYAPPDVSSAAVMAGVAPILVLLGFALVVIKVIRPEWAAIGGLATTIGLVYEMTVYQRTMDRYNAEFAQRHLKRLSAGELEQFVQDESNHEETRAFVSTYLMAGCELLLDGQRPSQT